MTFEELKQDISNCRICQKAFGFEPNPVLFGQQKTKIVQISQAPSATVHKTGKPFTDLSGKKLKYEWYQITEEEFYNENNFYIGAMAHCFPGKNSSGGDRNPPKVCYTTWVTKEIELLDNELFIIIGAKAAKAFFPKEDFNSLVFKDNVLNGKKAYVLPHPSPLNIKWFKDHPEFEEKRIPEIRKIIKTLIKKT